MRDLIQTKKTAYTNNRSFIKKRIRIRSLITDITASATCFLQRDGDSKLKLLPSIRRKILPCDISILYSIILVKQFRLISKIS